MPPIKWREQDVDLLRKQIRNFNRKVDRLMKAGSPEVKAALPPKMSMKTARAQISTRSEFNKTIKSISRFTERGSEKLIKTKGGVTAPKFEIKELEARVRTINAERKKRLQRLPEVPAGNIPMMGRVEREQLKPKKPVGKVKPEGWEKYKRGVYKQSDPNYYKSGDKRYKENYLKAYREYLGEDDAKIVEQMINENFTDEEFVLRALEDESMSIDYIYDPIQAQVKRQSIYRSLYGNIKGKESFSEKSFNAWMTKYGAD